VCQTCPFSARALPSRSQTFFLFLSFLPKFTFLCPATPRACAKVIYSLPAPNLEREPNLLKKFFTPAKVIYSLPTPYLKREPSFFFSAHFRLSAPHLEHVPKVFILCLRSYFSVSLTSIQIFFFAKVHFSLPPPHLVHVLFSARTLP
jgi:hypothetical protein